MIKKFFNWITGKNVNAMSFQQGLDLTGMPIVTLSQDNKKYNFILDTGSSDCIIDKRVLKDLNFTYTDKKSNLHGMEGVKREVSICNIAFSYKDTQYEYEYLVGDMTAAFDNIKQATGVMLHGILGSNFFNEFKYVLDFNELIAYSKA